jgi:hypothetical protein
VLDPPSVFAGVANELTAGTRGRAADRGAPEGGKRRFGATRAGVVAWPAGPSYAQVAAAATAVRTRYREGRMAVRVDSWCKTV